MTQPIKKILTTIFKASMFVLLFMGILFSCKFLSQQTNSSATPIPKAQLTVNGTTRTEAFPIVLKHLPYESEVTVSFLLPASFKKSILISSVYAPLKLYINNQLTYQYGTPGTYPAFFQDPPTLYDTLCLSEYNQTCNKEPISVKMVYTSPSQRHTLSIHTPIIGNETAILHYLVQKHGISLFLSLFFIFTGVILMILSVFFLQFQTKGQAIFLSGALSLCAGLWQFGENTLCVYLIHLPSFSYMLDFIGLFTLMIPLYKIGILFLNLPNHRLLKFFLLLAENSAAIAILFHFCDIMPFHKSLYYFHVLLPVCLCVLAGTTLYEALFKKNKYAVIFFLPFLALALAALLELLNYHVYFFPQFSSIFQIGFFLFMSSMILFSGIYVKKLFTANLKNMELKNELKLHALAIKSQKERNMLLQSHFEDIRKQRHDLRHHLHTIHDLIQKNESSSAIDYIQSVADSIPVYAPKTYCDNPIVNSTLSYYSQLAQAENIPVQMHVQIPYTNPNISDSDLCVIFGNLFENAIEACQRMRHANRSISISAQVHGEMLFISLENTYEGDIANMNGVFGSSKRSGFVAGTGLQSVQSLANRHNGSASFTTTQHRFRSEVCVKL